MKTTQKTRNLALLALFAAIILLLAFTPIGFIQLGFIKATIIHVPVIIASIVLGPKAGAGMGFLFGVTSLISNTMTPVISSFAFSPFIPAPGSERGSLLALAVCFVPRILVGVTPWFVWRLLDRLFRSKAQLAGLLVAGVAGSMTNTLLVMHLIYLLFKDAYASVQGMLPEAVYGFILTIITANGIPEAVVAAILTTAVCRALLAYLKGNKALV